MRKLFLRKEKFDAAVAEYGPAYERVIEPAIVERSDTHVVFDSRHQAYAAAAQLRTITEQSTRKIKTAANGPSSWGPRKWARLHEWAATADPQTVDAFIADFSASIGCPACRHEWDRLIAKTPVPKTTRTAIQHWTYDRHKEISDRLGKPAFTFAEAATKWGWLEPAPKVIIPTRVVCLSLESRDDRWTAFTASCQQSKYLSQWKIERYRARLPAEMIVPDWWPSKWNASHYATRVDHLHMVEQSYLAEHETILIFEDDAIVQPAFDEAYEAACASLPDKWMGLWLTNSGIVAGRITTTVGPGLVRTTGQYFLHAWMLSRRGMHRVWSHVTFNPARIIDGTIADLQQLEPHFYSVTRDAVIQVGDRSKSTQRTDYFGRVGVAK